MNTMKTFLLMALLSVMFVMIGGALGGQSGMTIALLFAGVMNFVSYWWSDKIVLKIYGAKELTRNDDPELFRMTEELTQRANLPMPKLYKIEGDQPNAFATGRDPNHSAVAVT
ncbi:MAG: M48 family metalloprotease, partial [Bacteroidota bacterium]